MDNENTIICRTCREELSENEFPVGSNDCYDCQESREDVSYYKHRNNMEYSRNINFF